MNPRDSTDSIHHDSAGFRLAVSPEYSICFGAVLWTDARDFEQSMAQARSVAGGRGPNWILKSPRSPKRIRVRPCRHGGVIGPWLGDRSLSATRVLREFSLWNALFQQRIPLPVPVFAISRRQGFFWRSAFASIEREDALDGLAWLEGSPSVTQIETICVAFAESTRRLHDAGAIHGDLQIRNILVESQHCLFIDLDRTHIVHRVSPRQRVRELLRFARSLEKTGHAEITSKRYRAIVLSAYCNGDRSLRHAMMRWSPLEAVGMLRHRIAWRIARVISKPSGTA